MRPGSMGLNHAPGPQNTARLEQRAGVAFENRSFAIFEVASQRKRSVLLVRRASMLANCCCALDIARAMQVRAAA